MQNLVNMSSHRQQPQMLSSHLAPNPKVARSQRPLGSNPTDMNNFLTGVLSSVSHFYTLCPMMQQPAHAHAPSLYRFCDSPGEKPYHVGACQRLSTSLEQPSTTLKCHSSGCRWRNHILCMRGHHGCHVSIVGGGLPKKDTHHFFFRLCLFLLLLN